MKMFLTALMIFTSLSSFAAEADGRLVIYVQDLLEKNHRGFKELQKKAQAENVVLEWEQYETRRDVVANPTPAQGSVDYVITEVEGYEKKRERSMYGQRTLRYVLTQVSTQFVVAQSVVLHKNKTGGCNDRGMCVQMQESDKQLGTTETSALVNLIKYAKIHAKK